MPSIRHSRESGNPETHKTPHFCLFYVFALAAVCCGWSIRPTTSHLKTTYLSFVNSQIAFLSSIHWKNQAANRQKCHLRRKIKQNYKSRISLVHKDIVPKMFPPVPYLGCCVRRSGILFALREQKQNRSERTTGTVRSDRLTPQPPHLGGIQWEDQIRSGLHLSP